MPKSYRSPLDVVQTEFAIKHIKDYFQTHLSKALNLRRVSAPVIVLARGGVNDYLNGVERPVRFHVKELNEEAEVVQSLAKWKRAALADYGFKRGEGLYTDMNAIRPDEVIDNLHSVYVDQWDWERVINASERNEEFLRKTVYRIYDAIKKAERYMRQEYDIPQELPDEIRFVTTGELEKRYPGLSRKERENEAAKAAGALFLMQIGWPLQDGSPHDGRAPDYDDWSLNGDIIVWNPVLQAAFELSSMGIRVDGDALLKQLDAAGAMDRLGLEFHSKLTEGSLPLSVGGGIGQSRLSMLLLRKAHIGEVQASVWPPEMLSELERSGIRLL